MKTQLNKISNILSGLLWMSVLSGLVIALILIFNWLPSQIQQNTAQQYNTIEAAKKAAGVNNILVPVYIPEYISWPPSLILAQKKPFHAVVMDFKNIRTNYTHLFIIQSSSQESEARFQKLAFTEVLEETEYILKGKNALLIVGECNRRVECSKIIWQDGGIYCSVFLMSSSFDLIKIAESMIR